MSEEIVNKVAQSGLITFDLEEYYTPGERVVFDIKPFLFEGLILKEKDFRLLIKNYDWSQFSSKHVAVFCSADAIIPTWAFMLIEIALQAFAISIVFGDRTYLENQLYIEVLSKIDYTQYKDQRVVIKGCSKHSVPVNAYLFVCHKLQPFAKSIMYGEPCSTVPLFKKVVF